MFRDQNSVIRLHSFMFFSSLCVHVHDTQLGKRGRAYILAELKQPTNTCFTNHNPS